MASVRRVQNDQVSEASFWQVQCIRRSKHQQLEWVSRVHILRCQKPAIHISSRYAYIHIVCVDRLSFW